MIIRVMACGAHWGQLTVLPTEIRNRRRRHSVLKNTLQLIFCQYRNSANCHISAEIFLPRATQPVSTVSMGRCPLPGGPGFELFSAEAASLSGDKISRRRWISSSSYLAVLCPAGRQAQFINRQGVHDRRYDIYSLASFSLTSAAQSALIFVPWLCCQGRSGSWLIPWE